MDRPPGVGTAGPLTASACGQGPCALREVGRLAWALMASCPCSPPSHLSWGVTGSGRAAQRRTVVFPIAGTAAGFVSLGTQTLEVVKIIKQDSGWGGQSRTLVAGMVREASGDVMFQLGQERGVGKQPWEQNPRYRNSKHKGFKVGRTWCRQGQ